MSDPDASAASSRAERQAEIDQLWAARERDRDGPARDALTCAYYPLVKHIARRLSASLSHRVEVEDLEGYGAEGLLEAIDRYDLARGVQFATFAAHRIRGAIYDGIRRSDWAPRSIRRREREIQESHAWLCVELGRAPTEDEEAHALGLEVSALRTCKAQIQKADVGSLEAATTSRDDRRLDEPADETGGPLSLLLEGELSAVLRDGVRSLRERERAVTTLSLAEGMTLAEIGRLLGVTESRACQIRASAIRSVRAYVRARGLAPV